MSENKTDPRFYAIRNAAFSDREAARRLIDSDPTIVEAKNSIGETALHFLAVENQLEAVEFLAQRGSDVNNKNSLSRSESAVLEAAQVGHMEMVDLLLKLGAMADGPQLLEAVKPAKREGLVAILQAHGVAV